MADDDIFADLIGASGFKPLSKPAPAPHLSDQRTTHTPTAAVMASKNSATAHAGPKEPVLPEPDLLDSALAPAGGSDANGNASQPQLGLHLSRDELESLVRGVVDGALDITMSKFVRSLRTVLEDMGRRIEATGAATISLKDSVDQLRELFDSQAANMQARFTNVDLAIKEVERGVQSLRDKQELLEAQAMLAKLSTKVDTSDAAHKQPDTPQSAAAAPPSAPAAASAPAVPAAAPVAAAEPAAPSHVAPAAAPPAPAAAPAPVAPPQPQLTGPPAAQYAPPPAAPAPAQYSATPAPQMPGAPYSAPPVPQQPQQQQQPYQQQQPQQPGPSSTSSSYGMAPPPMQQQGPPGPPLGAYGPPPGVTGPPPPGHMGGPPPPGPPGPMGPPAHMLPHAPPMYGPPPGAPMQQGPPGGPKYPVPPAGAYPPPFRTGPGPSGPPHPHGAPPAGRAPSGGGNTIQHVALDQVVSDIVAMGFSHGQVMSVVRQMQANGQQLDMNVIIDRCMANAR